MRVSRSFCNRSAGLSTLSEQEVFASTGIPSTRVLINLPIYSKSYRMPAAASAKNVSTKNWSWNRISNRRGNFSEREKFHSFVQRIKFYQTAKPKVNDRVPIKIHIYSSNERVRVKFRAKKISTSYIHKYINIEINRWNKNPFIEQKN